MTALGAVTAPQGRPRCEFALCRREAELEVTIQAPLVPLRVCGLHVSPVLTWGQVEPLEPLDIVRIRTVPPAAA